MHHVHIYFGKEWSRSGDDQWDGDLTGLLELADVTSADIPGNVSAYKGPPVSLRDESICCVESVVSGVIVGHCHGFGSLFAIQNSLVGTLWVMPPKYIITNKEVSHIADNKGELVVRNAIGPFH